MAFNKQKALEAARKYRDKGQKDKAIKEYLKVVREDPKDVRVWLKIGDLYAQKGAKSEATETYLKVAKFYSEQGFYLKSVAVYKQILKLDPRMVEVNLKLAELYRQLGLISDAMQHFETVAAFFHREGQTKEALATIRQLVDLDPENVATRIKLAELYSKEQMVEEAVAEFQLACDYLKRNHREDDYVKVAERLLWHKPDRIDLARELAALYLNRRDPRRALQKLQVCFKADQRDVETLALLAQAFQALEQKGKTVSVLKELARVLSENGQRSQAIEVHKKILAYVPDDPDSLEAVGQPQRQQQPVEVSHDRPRQERLASIADGASAGHEGGAAAKPTGAMPIVSEDEAEGFASDLSLDAEPHLADGSSASAEVHADEIVKILTETDVYVKYGLHQKAIDHLRRVFELDSNNIEARERLKDILLHQNRTQEAIQELMNLAEMTVSADPDRAEGFVREILELEPGHVSAVELARRFRLDVTKALSPAPEVEIVDDGSESFEFDLEAGRQSEPQLDAVLDFADLDMDDGSAGAQDQRQQHAYGEDAYQGGDHGRPPSYDLDYQQQGGLPPETLDPSAFDDLSLGGQPAPAHGGQQPEHERPAEGGYGQAPGHGAEPPESTMEMSFEQVEEAVSYQPPLAHPTDVEDLDFDRHDDFGRDTIDSVVEPIPSPRADSLEEQLDQALIDESGRRVPPAQATEDSFVEEIHDIEELDGEVIEELHSDELEVMDSQADYAVPEEFAEPTDNGFGQEVPTRLQSPSDIGELPAPPPPQQLAPEVPGAQVDPTQEVQLDQVMHGGGAGGAGLDDDLDEVDFFLSQGLFDEAREILSGLSQRYPDNPLVAAKLSELEDAVAAQVGGAPADPSVPFEEPLPPDPTAESERATQDDDKPAVIVGNEVDDADAATHFDLGQAYKEMGLFDEAVKEFQKVLVIHAREVQCHLMIGLCYREQDKLSEAITQFKAGLYVANISESEKFGLYYEIGVSYEALSDPQEALYYYEMLTKKDPDYRDVAERVQRIRGSGTGTQRRSTLDEDTDAALDGLK